MKLVIKANILSYYVFLCLFLPHCLCYNYIYNLTIYINNRCAMKKFSLLRYFTIFSAIAFVITGTILGYFISNHIKNDKLKNTKDITTLTLNVILKSELSPQELNKSFNADKIRLLDSKYRNALEFSDISDIKIWDKGGNILYSNESIMIGKHFSLTPNIERALNNKSILDVEESNSKNTIGLYSSYKKIIKI